jgi:hypothetical protein
LKGNIPSTTSMIDFVPITSHQSAKIEENDAQCPE